MESDQLVQCNLFDKDKQDDLFKFLYSCIDESCQLKGPEFRQFTNVDWTKEEFNTVHTLILTIFQNPSCLFIDNEKMPQEYNELPENVQQAVLTCLKVRKNQLVNSLLHKYSRIHTSTLSDFDWRLKYVMGSSKVASIKEPLLQLDLILENKQKAEIFALEVDKEELDSMINVIENIVN